MSTVYTTAESHGNLRGFTALVYNEIVQKQADYRNHNPRVGGSSPSSATIP